MDELDARQVDVREARDAQLVAVVLERFVGLRHVLDGVGHLDLLRHEVLRGIGEQTARLAGLVAHDGAAVGVGGVGGDAGYLERLAVHPVGVVRHVADHDGLVGADGIEVLLLRPRVRAVGLQVGVLHERPAVIHLVIGVLLHECADDAQVLVVVRRAVGDGDLEHLLVVRLRPVQVAVHEARAEKRALEIHHLRVGARVRLGARGVAHVHDGAPCYGDGFGRVVLADERLGCGPR